jgi:hypothetical protein
MFRESEIRPGEVAIEPQARRCRAGFVGRMRTTAWSSRLETPPRRDQHGVILQHFLDTPDGRPAAGARCRHGAVSHHMQVQIRHHLAAGGFADLLHRDAVGLECRHRAAGNFVRAAGNMGTILSDTSRILRRRLRDRQGVPGCAA